MISINEIKHRLPEDFMEEIYESFSPVTVDKILLGMTDDRFPTLRINSLKYNIQDLMR